ncbi:hypothetical protein ACFQ7F_00690 [Streptomyces sp. NPDC056486]|uniref:hypothetical protein n=1 Tax=Streptomyces sp. NPDC056486 TaxID=3345835 RepID=UPI00369B3479
MGQGTDIWRCVAACAVLIVTGSACGSGPPADPKATRTPLPTDPISEACVGIFDGPAEAELRERLGSDRVPRDSPLDTFAVAASRLSEKENVDTIYPGCDVPYPSKRTFNITVRWAPSPIPAKTASSKQTTVFQAGENAQIEQTGPSAMTFNARCANKAVAMGGEGQPPLQGVLKDELGLSERTRLTALTHAISQVVAHMGCAADLPGPADIKKLPRR